MSDAIDVVLAEARLDAMMGEAFSATEEPRLDYAALKVELVRLRRLAALVETPTDLLPPWTPFQNAIGVKDETSGIAKRLGIDDDMVVKNSRYQVHVRFTDAMGLSCVHLSIRSLDRQARHDWRDFQRIKNELCGDEAEAIELYPAESRLVDTSNQYHLWVFPPGKMIPVGYDERLISDGNWLKSQQRPFEPGCRPADCLDAEQFEVYVQAQMTATDVARAALAQIAAIEGDDE